ncbi:hypothetical protein [Kitasatospora sp. MAP5-34]|uniref:hypothetical protein n=1 Tax=Kitasatospora sp. MAP5-34 TaxID=3035102 RepID=UPI0024758E41|nr:hypothetical protein [Kitasatospora sp. MAP5-34]MDH6580773.1 hypothetical protein [Kitasatospora sp. MAP5-34]
MIVSSVYKVAWKLLAVPAVGLRRDAAKDAELLVLGIPACGLTNNDGSPNGTPQEDRRPQVHRHWQGSACGSREDVAGEEDHTCGKTS